MVYRGVGGLYKGSKKTLEVLKEGVVGIGVQGGRVLNIVALTTGTVVNISN